MLDAEDDFANVAYLNPEATAPEFATFEAFVERLIVMPFGSRLYQLLHDMFLELDLSDNFYKLLKERREQESGGMLRRH